MRSGGYIEIVDILLTPLCNDGSMPAHSIFKRWEGLGKKFNEATGKEFFNGEDAKVEMVEAGFVDVVQKTFKLPLGPWSIDPKYREIGKVGTAFLTSALHPKMEQVLADTSRFTVVRAFLAQWNAWMDYTTCETGTQGKRHVEGTILPPTKCK